MLTSIVRRPVLCRHVIALVLGLTAIGGSSGWGQMIYPVGSQTAPPAAAAKTFDLSLLGDGAGQAADGARVAGVGQECGRRRPLFPLPAQQVKIRIDEPVFVTPVHDVLLVLEEGSRNRVHRARHGEESGDRPDQVCGLWSGHMERAAFGRSHRGRVHQPRVAAAVDRQPAIALAGYSHALRLAQCAGSLAFYVSPGMAARACSATPGSRTWPLRTFSPWRGRRKPGGCPRCGRGHYVPLRLKRLDEKHVDKFETSFEECAPGRNSAANEWSAFGAIGNMDFNCMGRELWVRYPAFELAVPPARRKVRHRARPIGELPLGAGQQPIARHLGRLATRRVAVQGFGDDRSQPAMRELRSVQAGGSESHGQAAAEQAVCRRGRTAGHARSRTACSAAWAKTRF